LTLVWSAQASLWTREHLEKRLLEPLGGLSLSISQVPCDLNPNLNVT